MRTREFAIMLCGMAGAGLAIWLTVVHLSILWVFVTAWPGYIAGQLIGVLVGVIVDALGPKEAPPAPDGDDEGDRQESG